MKLSQILRSLGPGLLYAGAAVGVSHLVQSTRAGAGFGFDLIWILILANVLKYPFFEFGPRYALATGNSLIVGYRQIGKWAIWAFGLLTISTMFAIQAAVTIVTAGLVGNIFNLHIGTTAISSIILILLMVVLLIGRYAILDRIIKWVIITLAVSTIVAVSYAFISGAANTVSSNNFYWNDSIHLLFLIAFIGWMPAPIDVSVWHSLWSTAKKEKLKDELDLKGALLDFKIGYIGTAFLALGFLLLGALIMFGSEEELSPKGIIFADQLIRLYTGSIGKWAYPVIAIAALTTMLSTTLTVLDAYPRVLKPTTRLLLPKLKTGEKSLSIFWMILLVAGALLLMQFFTATMRFMVDLATTISFVTAPLLAILNYLAVTDNHVPKLAQPKPWLKVYAWIGIAFLTGFSIIYIIWMIF